MLGQSGLGYLAQIRSLASGYVIGGTTTLLALPVLIYLRRLNSHQDYIMGDAGKSGVCAAQGLPEVATIDPKSRRAA
jgi:hypothetical protein